MAVQTGELAKRASKPPEGPLRVADELTKRAPAGTAPGPSPARLALIVTVIIFTGEIAIMVLLSAFQPMSELVETLLDSCLLVLMMIPSLYFLQLWPLKRQIEEREAAVRALERSRDELEDRVRERTAELVQTGTELKISFRAVEKARHEESEVAELMELLQACRTRAESEDMLRLFGPKLFQGESGAIYAYRASKNLLELAVFWGTEPAEAKFAPEDCWALRRGRQHLVEEEHRTLRCHHLADPAAAAALCIPMMAQGETTGVLVLWRNRTKTGPIEISTDSRRMASIVAEQVALALAKLDLREKLRDQAIRDPLTGMFNRCYFEETAERELHRAGSRESGAGVIMTDIDHFKEIQRHARS